MLIFQFYQCSLILSYAKFHNYSSRETTLNNYEVFAQNVSKYGFFLDETNLIRWCSKLEYDHRRTYAQTQKKKYLNHILPWWNFFKKFCYQRRFLTKWIYLVLFLKKKNQIWFKNPKISFRKFKLTPAEGEYRLFLKKTQVFREQ